MSVDEASRGDHKWRGFRKGSEIPWGGGWASRKQEMSLELRAGRPRQQLYATYCCV